MRLKFFVVEARAPETGQEDLNAFCARHRVLALEKQFVAQGAESYWAICATYLEGGEQAPTEPSLKRDRVDYREVLNEQDFAVYVQLRDLRKTMAEREGVPAYALFTNEQLAEMVTRRVRSRAALGEIDGVGKSRLEKYSDAFLELLESAFAGNQGERADEAPAHRAG